MTSARCVLVRHGEVDYAGVDAYAPVYRGARGDFAPLTDSGVAQVTTTAASLDVRNPRIVCSPFTRTVQTAAIVAQRFGTQFTIDLELHDWLPYLDGATGYTYDEWLRVFERYQACSDPGTTRTWESDEEMHARIVRVVRRHLGEMDLVLVTHEVLIKLATGVLLVPLGSAHNLVLDEGKWA